jgi:hypothetical protein
MEINLFVALSDKIDSARLLWGSMARIIAREIDELHLSF